MITRGCRWRYEIEVRNWRLPPANDRRVFARCWQVRAVLLLRYFEKKCHMSHMRHSRGEVGLGKAMIDIPISCVTRWGCGTYNELWHFNELVQDKQYLISLVVFLPHDLTLCRTGIHDKSTGIGCHRLNTRKSMNNVQNVYVWKFQIDMHIQTDIPNSVYHQVFVSFVAWVSAGSVYRCPLTHWNAKRLRLVPGELIRICGAEGPRQPW